MIDERIQCMTVNGLRALGHDVKDIRGTADQGSCDSDLWKIAMAEGRLLITTDKGFTESRGEAHPGILIVRLRQPNRLNIHRSVMHAAERVEETDWPGLLVVVRDATMSMSQGGSRD